MTIEKGATALKKEVNSLLFLMITVMLGISLSGEISEYVKDGLMLAVGCVVPTSLPFMIISDIYVCYGRPENIRLLRWSFKTLFGISPYGLAPFICGNVGGFPIGAKMCADLYRSGYLSKNEAERLSALSNNPSCAFVVGAVGLGIYGDLRLGFMLLSSVYAATVICGIITRRNNVNTDISDFNTRQNYSFVASVKNAGISSIGIISFISIFSAINGIIKKRIKNAPVLYLISAFLELTNAIKLYASPSVVPRFLSLVLSAFSLGFGGICVGLQSAVFTSSAELGMRRYYLIKLLEGILAASIFSILFIVINQ